MKITLAVVGKTNQNFVKEGMEEYLKRLKFYIPFEVEVIPELKNTKHLSAGQQKEKEGELILNLLQPDDYLVLLDEKGKEFTSMEFASYIEKKMQVIPKKLVFLIGGPYGFSTKVYQRSTEKLSLSKMTFSHQMIRLIFTEQLYRAMTILKNEPYHHP